MVILTTIYLLNRYQSPRRADLYEISIRDSGLPARLEQAERVYSKVVGDRKEMIRKFGPTAKDISMCVNACDFTSQFNVLLSGSRKISIRGQRILSVSARK